MLVDFKLPDVFVPEERDFCLYCAVKMFKGNLISRDEAIRMANVNTKMFDEALSVFEKRFAKIAGDELVDSAFMEDKDFRETGQAC